MNLLKIKVVFFYILKRSIAWRKIHLFVGFLYIFIWHVNKYLCMCSLNEGTLLVYRFFWWMYGEIHLSMWHILIIQADRSYTSSSSCFAMHDLLWQLKGRLKRNLTEHNIPHHVPICLINTLFTLPYGLLAPANIH